MEIRIDFKMKSLSQKKCSLCLSENIEMDVNVIIVIVHWFTEIVHLYKSC